MRSAEVSTSDLSQPPEAGLRQMLVEVYWSELQSPRNPLWNDRFCLYAYFHPKRDWLIYLGKADFATVRQRLHGRHKRALFRDVARRYYLEAGDVRVFHGEVLLQEGRRLSSPLLADAESLLIMRLAPFGNTQSRLTRIERPGLRVHCEGDWPFKRFRFHDIA